MSKGCSLVCMATHPLPLQSLRAQAQLDDIAVLKAEVAQLQAIKEDQVKEADSHLQQSNEWCGARVCRNWVCTSNVLGLP